MQNFLTYGANELTPRGIWAMGHGFVEGNTGIDAAHTAFLANDLACSLRDPSYYALSGSVVRFPDLIPKTVINTSGAIYCAENSCLFTNDVLDVNVRRVRCDGRRRIPEPRWGRSVHLGRLCPELVELTPTCR